MKLNKRKCRVFADPGLKCPPWNGLLYAKQIDHIVRTAIKIIDHRKTLVIYVYPRKLLAKGNCQPCYTVFQTRDDFITLSRKEDGSTTWRKAAFENLGSNYRFSKSCAFYSDKDEKYVSRYFKAGADTDGFQTLSDAQEAVLALRRRERQLAKEKAIVARMAGLSALPRELKSWIKSIMPAYFFYDYKRGKDTSGICSACGHEIILSGIKQGNKAICPHCKHELIAKPRSRRGACMFDRETFEVIQSMGDGRLIVRIIKAYYSYTADIPKAEIYENTRQFIYLDNDNKICTEHYYYSHNSGILTNWKSGKRLEYIMGQYHFDGDTCGHLYTRNLPEALSGTPWQYCTIADFYQHFHERMQALPYLRAHLEHPRLEHLSKTGFYSIVSDLAYGTLTGCLNESQNRTHKILGVAAEDVPFLRDIDADLAVLEVFQGYAGIKDRQRLLIWQMEHDIKHNILPILKYITVHKLIRYTERQFLCLCQRKNKYGSIRYQKMQDMVTEYKDYLEMCDGLDYDMKNSFVLYPQDLQQSHDRVQKCFKIKENEQLLQDFKTAVQDARKHIAFEVGGMKIVVPATPGDLITEGNALHHCVGRYASSVAKKECMILFVRKCCEIDKPYYTVEIRGQKVVQVRGIGNCAATSEVQGFIDAFKQQVLLHGSVNNAA